VAVASAGPYASLHLTTQFFTGRMPFLPPNQQRQSTEGTIKLKVLLNSATIIISTPSNKAS